jgi:hypothetical protein
METPGLYWVALLAPRWLTLTDDHVFALRVAIT